MEPEHPQQPIAALLRGAFGAQTAQILYIAAKLGLADRLHDSPQTAAQLAHTLDLDVGALQRVLRGLISLGVCNEGDGQQFGLTSLGEYLRADHSDSRRTPNPERARATHGGYRSVALLRSAVAGAGAPESNGECAAQKWASAQPAASVRVTSTGRAATRCWRRTLRRHPG